MQRRTFGRTGVTLPALCLGSMRFDPKRLDASEGARLIEEAHALGVDAWHSSSEYDTHAHFCASLRVFRRDHPSARVTHLSKIAAPHFEDRGFDPSVLRARVEQQLRELATDTLDVVQWLARSKPVTDALRLPALDEMRDALGAEVDALRREGKVRAWAAFPYSKPWATAFEAHAVCDGLVTYLNLAETEYAADLDRMAAAGDGFVAIRPLMAGLFGHAPLDDAQRAKRSAIVAALAREGIEEGAVTDFALRFPLLHANVASVMLSVTTSAHLREAASSVGDVTPDHARFARVVASLA
jgi:aryl-alcohol dehydrogenase-like predicted oxidoreductase